MDFAAGMQARALFNVDDAPLERRACVGGADSIGSNVIVMRKPGALSPTLSCMACSSATAATKESPSPLPGVLMLGSSR